MHTFLWLAIVLLVAWLVLKFALAMTGAALHILWILAVVAFIIWLFRQIAGRPTPPAA